MLPTKKTYKIQVENAEGLIDDVFLTDYANNPDRFRVHSDPSVEDVLVLPWMSKQDLVAWFRKAADLIEEAKFE